MIDLLKNIGAEVGAALGLYEASRTDQYHTTPPDLQFNYDELIDLAEWDTLRNCGREVYSNFSPVAGAVHEKADNAIGQHWIPIYYGDDREWGKRATQFLKEAYKVLDVRGQPFDFTNNLWLGSKSLDVDGDYFIRPLLTKTGFPQFQFLEAHNIGDRYGLDESLLEKVPGATRFSNGVFFDSANRPIAYYFMTGRINDPVYTDKIIPASDMIHVFDPVAYSQGRGVPGLVYGLLDWKDVKKFRENEATAQVAFSALTVLEKNAGGKPDLMQERFSNTATTKDDDSTASLVVEKYLRGAVRYIKANGKNELEAFHHQRPPKEAVTFMEHIMRGAFVGIGWPYEQAYDIKGLGTAAVRSITNKCQRSINRRQKVLHYPAAKIITFAIAAASNAKMLGRTTPPDWFKWKFALPPHMTADQHREAAQDRDDYRLGFITLEEIYAKRGEWWVDNVDQRFAEEMYYNEKVLSTGIPIERVRMLTPNGNPVQGTEEDEDEKEVTKKNEKQSRDS